MNKTASATPKPVLTGDGSHTLYSPQFNQHYHNPNGAMAESRYIFLQQSGLTGALASDAPPQNLTILETGFGTGLNLLLLLDEYNRMECRTLIEYYSIEAYPLDKSTAENLNYGDFLSDPNLAGLLPGLFESVQPGMNRFEPVSGVTLHLFIGLFDSFEPEALSAGYLFHDPFSPEVNGELWSSSVFQKLAGWSATDAVLSTYCAASKARGAMAAAGWKVARAPGALGKREMTLASLNPEKLSHLERINEERLARRYEEGDFNS